MNDGGHGLLGFIGDRFRRSTSRSIDLLMLPDELLEIVDVRIRLREKQCQARVLLLVDELPVAFFVFVHQAFETLLLLAFLLLDQFAFVVREVRVNGLVHLARGRRVPTVVVVKVACVRLNGVEEFLVLGALTLFDVEFTLTFVLLGRASLAKVMTLRTFVRAWIECCLNQRVLLHRGENLAAELLLKLKQLEGLHLDEGLCTELDAHLSRHLFELVKTGGQTVGKAREMSCSSSVGVEGWPYRFSRSC